MKKEIERMSTELITADYRVLCTLVNYDDGTMVNISNMYNARGRQADLIIWWRQPTKDEYDVIYPCICANKNRNRSQIAGLYQGISISGRAEICVYKIREHDELI